MSKAIDLWCNRLHRDPEGLEESWCEGPSCALLVHLVGASCALYVLSFTGGRVHLVHSMCTPCPLFHSHSRRQRQGQGQRERQRKRERETHKRGHVDGRVLARVISRLAVCLLTHTPPMLTHTSHVNTHLCYHLSLSSNLAVDRHISPGPFEVSVWMPR